jgi:hypothetical protein
MGADNGWITDEVFLGWFRLFLDSIQERPLLILCDGHRSHVTLDVIRVAREKGVEMLKLPSHTTQLLQPLDVSVFKSLKTAWDKVLVNYQRTHQFRMLTKAESVDLLCSCWQEGTKPTTIISGFQSTGVYPFCREKYPTAKFDQLQLQSYQQWKSTSKQPLNLFAPQQHRLYTPDMTYSIGQPTGAATPSQQQRVPPKHLPLLEPTAAVVLTPPHQQLNDLQQTPLPMLTPSPSTIPSSSSSGGPDLHNFFMTQFSTLRSAPSNELALKRRRIQRSAAVITHEQYTKAVKELDRLANEKIKSTKKNTKKMPAAALNDEEDADDLPPMPPPLPKAPPTPSTTRLPRLPRLPRSTLSPSSNRLQRKRRSAVICTGKAVCSNASQRANVDKSLRVENEGEECLYCTEPYGSSGPREKWLRCRGCLKWAHNLCSGISPSLTTFVCDLCL